MTDLNKAMSFVNALPLLQMKPDELAHYGILGMHWGIRKPESVDRESREDRHIRNTRRKLAVSTLGASVAAPKIASEVKKRQAAARARQSEDHVTSRTLLKKKKHELSNAEIQKIVDRLQKEHKLSQLNPSKVERGKKIALGAVAAMGTATTVYTFINSPLGKRAVAQGASIVQAILLRRVA